MKNVITLGKLIGLLLLLFCLPFLLLLSVKLHTKIQGMSSLACLVMGTIFLVYLVLCAYKTIDTIASFSTIYKVSSKSILSTVVQLRHC